jgi:hypothetical protein
MFDLRYHVASLAAVFIALVIGILVGVGIADRGVREDALREQLAKVSSDRDQEKGRADFLGRRQEATQNFVEDSYPALMSRRLEGKRVALLFVGSANDDVRSSVGKAISDADGRVALVRALKLPVNRGDMQRNLANRSLAGRYAGDDGLGELGRDLATELTSGGETPLWNAVSDDLVEEQSGRLRPVDAVVIARTVPPQHGATGRFLTGLYSGLGDASLPVVGVENSDASTTAIGVYRKNGLSSVDDLEDPTGRLALALLLAGGPPGQYGVRETDDALMPPIEPLPASG